MLAARDLPVGRIVEEFEMSTPAISQHLKVLREAGLVNSRVSGAVADSVAQRGRPAADPGLAGYDDVFLEPALGCAGGGFAR